MHVLPGILTTFLTLLLLAAPATAQQQGAPQQQAPPPDVEVDDQELETVAEAYVDVQSLTDEYNQRIQQAESAEEAQSLQAEYAEKATSTVEDQGLSIDRYDNVVRAATVDEELRDRLLAQIETIVGTPDER